MFLGPALIVIIKKKKKAGMIGKFSSRDSAGRPKRKWIGDTLNALFKNEKCVPAECGGACLSSQHLGGSDKWISESEKASLIYTVSSRTSRTTQRDPVSKTNKKTILSQRKALLRTWTVHPISWRHARSKATSELKTTKTRLCKWVTNRMFELQL